MRFFNNKKSNNEVVDAVLKEGEKIYREVKNEETGDVTYEEIEIPGNKKENDKDDKSEEKPNNKKVDVVKAAAVIGIATITAATVGKIWHNPKDKKSESDAETNSGFEDSAE